jgi:hypothetical protein
MLVTAMTIMELSIAVVSIIGACGACLHGSKCTSCKVGCSGCELKRSVPNSDPGAEPSPEPLPLQVQQSTDADYTLPAPSHGRQ